MNLFDWLKTESLRQRVTQLALREKLATAGDVHPNTIWQIANGKACSPKLAAVLSGGTAGAVTVQELLYPEGLPTGAAMCPAPLSDSDEDLDARAVTPDVATSAEVC